MKQRQVFSTCFVACFVIVSLVFISGYFVLNSHIRFSWLRNTYFSESLVNETHDRADSSNSAPFIPELARTFTDKDICKNFSVGTNGSDVLVHLRIQKTGSTSFSRHLSFDITTESICRSLNATPGTSECARDVWWQNVLFMRGPHSWLCGTHADWTTLRECAKRAMQARHGGKKIVKRLLYVTTVRDGVNRFISEWLHVQRGATWYNAAMRCRGRQAYQRVCYKTTNWKGVTLNEFMNCTTNLAFNRQTRMLADLTLVNCYNTSGMSYEERHMRMVRSALRNLKNMAYFGLTEYQYLSQLLFEQTFNLKFKYNFVTTNEMRSATVNLTKSEMENIRELNKYDHILYQYAKKLFRLRLQRALGVKITL